MVVSASVESEDYGKRNSADNTGEQEIICKKKSQDGSTHSVTIEDLKRCLLQLNGTPLGVNDGATVPLDKALSTTAVLLPAVHAAAITCMRKHDVKPLIIVIKFKNEYGCTELSAIEESLDHGRGHYETVVVPESLAEDFSSFSEHVLQEVSRLVEKYTFLFTSAAATD